MNRKQRRAAAKQSDVQAGAGNGVFALFAQAKIYHQQRRFDEAVRAYNRVLALKPDHAEAANNLGNILHLQGKPREASAAFARALELAPELHHDFGAICATLTALVPVFGEAMQRALAAWPQRPSLRALLGDDSVAAIAADPLLLTILKTSPVRAVAFECALSAIRPALLQAARTGDKADRATLGFCAALAQQCFINEYVFATSSEEEGEVAQLVSTIESRLREREPIGAFQLAALAMYMPLHRLCDAGRLIDREWPSAVAEIVTQQVREPRQELALRASIPALTPIADEISNRVRQQYEDNPYPRWVRLAAAGEPQSFDRYLSDAIPNAAFAAPAFGDTVDVLIAGCGTGAHPIELARKLKGARVLAIDLSLSSLAYAKRKTPPGLAGQIDYAQADILELGRLGRSFDVIDSSGVLHHMAEPLVGLRVLLSLLRPGGFLRLGLYSRIARRTISAGRIYLAERGYDTTAESIRRARQDLVKSEHGSVARSSDYYTTSGCRDLLFHVQEHQMTLPEIKEMLSDNGLRFIGFEFDPLTARRAGEAFAAEGKSPTDLDAWDAFEQRNPDAFRAMYQFWTQKL